MKLNHEIIEFLACPRCKGGLDNFACKECNIEYPLKNEIPILINETNSLFTIDDFMASRETTYKSPSNFKKAIKSLIPSINLNIRAKEKMAGFFSMLEGNAPRVLIIGGAIEGEGFEASKIPSKITLIESDVTFGARNNLISDAHDIPFKNESFDGVIIQAVLEHVLAPERCVSEIWRVLKKDGFIYAETPFMQQVHAGRYDFMRFTHLGHRRLFRGFEEIDSGASCGPGMALAWSYCYFLQSFFSNKALGQMAYAFGSLTSFWLKYFDYFLINKPSAFDAASSYFFIGRKSDGILDDKELIKGYRGMIS